MDNKNSVFRSIEIIENRITEKLNVENIASGVYFSKYHYQRLFREIVGDSVMEYVNKRKLTLAGRALLETDASILDIAIDYGYDSRDGFARSFKAYMGVTPTEYRKYNLSAISQKTVKEKCAMLYSKVTDEIIRELNDFIAKAKETASNARKNKVTDYTPFWNLIADTTDDYADKINDLLKRITNIAECPDEITNRFAIIRVIEDIAFQSNLLAFNVGITIARGQPEHIRIQKPLCEKYNELAQAANLKSNKIAQFFNELSSLIFDDMRKSAAEKINGVVQTGKSAVESIVRYTNIKFEVNNVVNELSTKSINDITWQWLDDCLFKLNIISFSADIDVCRNLNDKSMFNNLSAFKDSLADAITFFETLIKPEANSIIERTTHKHLQDIAFQMNLFLFFTRGEIDDEKLGKFLNDEQKNMYNTVCEKIDSIIQFVHKAVDKTAYKEIFDRLCEITTDMKNQAEDLKEYGGSIYFIANEIKNLADHVAQHIVK